MCVDNADYAEEHAKTVQQLAEWMREGKLYSVEDMEYGIDMAPLAFLKLFQGSNVGKQVVQVGYLWWSKDAAFPTY